MSDVMASASVIGRSFTRNNTVPPANRRVLSLLSCKGKTAIVTGAAAGIGLAVAEALAEAGANVAIWYNSNHSAVDRAQGIALEYAVDCLFLSWPIYVPRC